MRPVSLTLVLAFLFAACAEEKPTPPAAAPAPKVAAPAPKPAAPAAPKTDAEKTVLDVALGSPDHTTLVAAVKATDLVVALNSPGGIYTVFAPTNAAFDQLPPGTVDALLKPEKKADLKKIVQHHATVPIMEEKDMKDGQVVSMSDGTPVTLHVKDGKYMVGEANIVGTVKAMNGIVYVIDKVLLPPAK